ncbi:hypothetical protein REPUB_Repub09cG0121100 [Reevesia pubescens]
MSVSIEALAMAGTDYIEWGMGIEEWEQEELEFPPAYLLADEEEGEEEIIVRSTTCSSSSSTSHFDLQSQLKVSMIIVLRVSIFGRRIMGKKLYPNA